MANVNDCIDWILDEQNKGLSNVRWSIDKTGRIHFSISQDPSSIIGRGSRLNYQEPIPSTQTAYAYTTEIRA